MKLPSSVILALAIAGAVTLYFGVKMLTAGAPTAAEEIAEAGPFPVVAETVLPEAWQDEVLVRGRSQALRKVTLRAETAGVVAATPVEPGTDVEAGAVLCRLKIDARGAGLEEARAALAKARLDYEAAVKLAAEGFRSPTSVAGAKAALDLAKANFDERSISVERTGIAAPWAGTFDARLTEIGDYLNVGDACGVLIQKTPFLIVGALSERDVAKVSQGDVGRARLATGETVEGVVRFVSRAADPATRTFEIQLEVPNEAGLLRDGVTAEFTVLAERRQAHRVPRSALTLDDAGRIGVRVAAAGDIVEFRPVTLLGEAGDGVFVSGIDGPARVITRGQDFVNEGQKVAVAADGSGA